jgi:hypothetical protein
MKTLVSCIQFSLLMCGYRRNYLLTTLLDLHLVSVIDFALSGTFSCLLAAGGADDSHFAP